MAYEDNRPRPEAGHRVVLEDREHLTLSEVVVERSHRFANRPLSQIPQAHDNRVILVKRGADTLIPTGSTVIKPGDILVMAQSAKK